MSGHADGVRGLGVTDTPFTVIVAATVTIHALSLGVPILTLQVYDRVLPSENVNTLAVLLAGVMIAILLEALLRLARSYLTLWLGARFEHSAANALILRVISSDPSVINKETVGSMLHGLTSIGRLKEFHPAQVVIAATDVVFVFVFLAIIYWIANDLVIVPIAVILTFILVSIPTGTLLRRALLRQDRADGERFDFIIERLTKIHVGKAFAMEKATSRRYEKLASHSSSANLEVTQSAAGSINLIAVFSHLMIGSLIAYGAVQVIDGAITVGMLIASVLLSGRAMQMAQRGVLQWVKYQDFVVARQTIQEIASMPPKVATGNSDAAVHAGSVRAQGIKIKSVSGATVLDVPAFQAEPGQVISIGGGAAQGRSELMKTLAGIFPTAEGTVFLDDQPIQEFSLKERARRVGYLGPHGKVFRGTIKDNITRFGEVPLAQALELARLLHVDRDVAKLPAGYDTFLDDAAADVISTGLCQRITLVRSLSSKPRVILYDNADQGLDETGFEAVCTLLSRLQGKATLILASDVADIVQRAGKAYHIDGNTLKPGRGDFVEQFEEIRI